MPRCTAYGGRVTLDLLTGRGCAFDADGEKAEMKSLSPSARPLYPRPAPLSRACG